MFPKTAKTKMSCLNNVPVPFPPCSKAGLGMGKAKAACLKLLPSCPAAGEGKGLLLKR